ncbi:F0F1 ATP synthase subunit C [Candidatus Nesciobacter abundans]|uniref:ATP synthase F(0) sector subunit c n=1 Tax=Candidatus Nesciobacter abundans TaxID=2601668 RepID=A0A5C0UFP3_9PROT|nr:F0F1 ATP synthase subunit C [Candidatus Nesciobacter abundans]QEK38878.1 F0F1 ATP synthase subunit C [Candidatus Nesciobacter abundans]
MDVSTGKMIAGALALLPLLGVAYGLSNIFSSLFKATAQNPVAKDSMSNMAVIGAGLLESVALLAFVIAILIVI